MNFYSVEQKKISLHHLEPHYLWRDRYVAAEDQQSPFYERVYSEFTFHNKIYNYYIHPQWDDFGSITLYLKVLYVDYACRFAVIEFIGEWNDCIDNDIMTLKRNVIDRMLKKGIYKFILIVENVLNFHASDDCYYEEWLEDVEEKKGWICLLNIQEQVQNEMEENSLHHYLYLGHSFNQINWRQLNPKHLLLTIQHQIK